MRILVADDDPSIRKALDRLLRKNGHSADIVNNGDELLKKLEPETYDVIITDFLMPGLDGLEVLRRIKADSRYESIPVIVYTATDDLREKIEKLDGIYANKNWNDNLVVVLESLQSRK